MRVQLLKNRLLAPGITQTAGSVIQVGDDDGAAMIADGAAKWVPQDTACVKDPTGWIGCAPPPPAPALNLNRAAQGGASKHASKS